MTAFPQGFAHRLSEPFYNPDSRFVGHHGFIRAGQVFKIKLLAVHTVKEEVKHIQNHSFSAFAFNNADNVVIGIGMIFYQNFSDYADFRLFLSGSLHIIKISYKTCQDFRIFVAVKMDHIMYNAVMPFIQYLLAGTFFPLSYGRVA